MNMKQVSLPTLFSIPILGSAICALLVVSAQQKVSARATESSNPSGGIFANSAADGGRLLIRRSPTLAHNVSITITIDGKLAGTLSRNRGFDRFITSGRHTLTATPNRNRGPWQTTLNVRAGETYSYTASYNVDKVVLTPAAVSR